MRGHFLSSCPGHACGPVCAEACFYEAEAARPCRVGNHLQTVKSTAPSGRPFLAQHRSDAARQLSASWTNFATNCPGPGLHSCAWNRFAALSSSGPAWFAVEFGYPDETSLLCVQMTHGNVRNEPGRYPQATASESPLLKQLRSHHDRQTFPPQGMKMVRQSLGNEPRTIESGQRQRSVRGHRSNRSITVAAPLRNTFRAAPTAAGGRP